MNPRPKGSFELTKISVARARIILQCKNKKKCQANSPDNRLFITVCRGGASTQFFDPVDTFNYVLKVSIIGLLSAISWAQKCNP